MKGVWNEKNILNFRHKIYTFKIGREISHITHPSPFRFFRKKKNHINNKYTLYINNHDFLSILYLFLFF